jgi:hypothetical protein
MYPSAAVWARIWSPEPVERNAAPDLGAQVLALGRREQEHDGALALVDHVLRESSREVGDGERRAAGADRGRSVGRLGPEVGLGLLEAHRDTVLDREAVKALGPEERGALGQLGELAHDADLGHGRVRVGGVERDVGQAGRLGDGPRERRVLGHAREAVDQRAARSGNRAHVGEERVGVDGVGGGQHLDDGVVEVPDQGGRGALCGHGSVSFS